MLAKRSILLAALPLALLASCGQSAGDHLEAAQHAFAQENYAAARVEALASLRKDDTSLAALTLLLRSQLRLADGEGAAATLDRLRRAAAGKAHLDPGEMARYAAETALLRGRPEEALRHLGVDGTAAAWRLRALVYLAQGKTEQADDAFRTGMAAGDDPVLLATYARLLVARGSLDEAARAAARLQKVAPASFDTFMTLGQIHASRGDDKAALAAYGKATAAHPERYEPLLARAQIVANQGKLAQAAKLLDQAAELAPDAPDLLTTRIQILAARKSWDKIVALMQSGDSALAPGSAEALIYGEALLNTGRPEQARVLFSRAQLMRPGDRQVRRLLGEAQIASGNAEDAYRTLESLAQSPLATLEEVHAFRRASDAAGYIETRDIDARLASPAFLSDAAMASKARTAADNADWPAAIALLERLLLAHPDNAEVLGALSEACFNGGQFVRAADYARRGLAIDPDSTVLASIASQAARKAGQ